MIQRVRQRAGRAAFLMLAAWGVYRNDPILMGLGLAGCLWLYSLAVVVTAYANRKPHVTSVVVDVAERDIRTDPEFKPYTETPPELLDLPPHLRGVDFVDGRRGPKPVRDLLGEAWKA